MQEKHEVCCTRVPRIRLVQVDDGWRCRECPDSHPLSYGSCFSPRGERQEMNQLYEVHPGRTRDSRAP